MARQRNTFQTPRVSDPVTARRASQAASTGGVAGAGSGVDGSGRITTLLGDGFYLDNRKVWQMRVRAPLVLLPGSPKAFTILLPTAQEIVDDAEIVASAVVDDSDTDGTTVSAALARLQANTVKLLDADYLLLLAMLTDFATAQGDIAELQRDLTAAQATIAALQANAWAFNGETTLVGGTKAVTLTGIDAASRVTYSPKTLLGTPGFLSWAITANTLTFTSTNPLDASVVDYVVWNP